jgi:uncharacterized protein
MLIEFCVGNYRSFRDTVTFSMVAANLKSQDKQLDENNVFDSGRNLRLLTSAAIYGANASGKSNLIQAMQFMRNFVIGSAEGTKSTGGIEVEPFRLNTVTEKSPSHFQTVFLVQGVRFRYGFEVTSERVVSEWLYRTSTIREACLFDRQGDTFTIGSNFREGKSLESKTRPRALFLSVAAQFNGKIAQGVIEWFRSFHVVSGLEDEGMIGYTLESFENGVHRDSIRSLVTRFDLGIQDVNVRMSTFNATELPQDVPEPVRELASRMPEVEFKQAEVGTQHQKFDSEGNSVGVVDFSLDEHESDGTRKLFAMAGPLTHTLKSGQILVIDEFDARLHPLITQAIIGLFNSAQTNPNHAQLVFATHDTNLLDRRFFRRDQVWFTEKDRQGATQLYSLSEFRVRNDATYDRDYIRGKYGAVPYVGDLGRIVSEEV